MNVSTVQKNILIQEKLSSNLTYDGLNLVFVFKILGLLFTHFQYFFHYSPPNLNKNFYKMRDY